MPVKKRQHIKCLGVTNAIHNTAKQSNLNSEMAKAGHAVQHQRVKLQMQANASHLYLSEEFLYEES